MTTSDELYVWIYLPGCLSPVVAGRLQIDETAAGSVGTFVYGRSYLAREDAIAIDPVSLPLRSGLHTFTTLNGFPGVILDACPDRALHTLMFRRKCLRSGAIRSTK